jgi:hypothetical protein
MMRKWTRRYGLAAAVTAIAIISLAMFVNPNIVPQTSAKSSFAVMLTDPPTVPAGTTVLNLTYSDISLHIAESDGTEAWVSVPGSGTVNSFSLVNMSQTLASTEIPVGSAVNKIQFTIVKVEAEINGTIYNVTTLSNTMVLSVANSRVNQTLSGVLIDFNPTLVQIKSVDAEGNPVDYYVLVPSASATVVDSLDRAQVRVGTIVRLGEHDRERLTSVVENFSQNISVNSASLTVDGNVTSLSVTITNTGDLTFRIFGLMLQDQFNTPQGSDNQMFMPNQHQSIEMARPFNSIPFQINGTTLVPLFGAGPQMQQMHPMNPAMFPQNNTFNPLLQGNQTSLNMPFPFHQDSSFKANQISTTSMQGQPFQPMNPQMRGPNQLPRQNQGIQPMNPIIGSHDDRNGTISSSYIALQPGQSITLTFSGVIAYAFAENEATSVISLVVGNTYTIQLMGEGFQSYSVTATA